LLRRFFNRAIAAGSSALPNRAHFVAPYRVAR